jgi:hypothetical protein
MNAGSTTATSASLRLARGHRGAWRHAGRRECPRWGRKSLKYSHLPPIRETISGRAIHPATRRCADEPFFSADIGPDDVFGKHRRGACEPIA